MATFFENALLLRGLFTGEKAYVGPYHVTVDVTNRCNMNCLGCRYHSDQVDFPSQIDTSVSEIPFDLIKRLCADLKIMGTNDIILIGEGEPFLHPHIFDIISEIKQAGFYLTIVTNGTLLDPDIIEKLIETHADQVIVSLWASSPEQYCRCYPGTNPENFDKTVEGLKSFARIKAESKSKWPLVIIHHVINRHNYRTIPEMVELAHETGCDKLNFVPFIAWKGQLRREFVPGDEKAFLNDSLHLAGERLNELNIRHNVGDALLRFQVGEKVWEHLPCYIAWFHARIKLDGTVLPCSPCNLRMGNVNEKNFPEIWNNEQFRKFRRNTLTREGLSKMGEYVDCGYCCHLVYNARIHRIFKWIDPVARLFRNGKGD